ncbi:MAG TPA: hypothetical protein VNA87_06470 [Actinomycetota bacterium]|nr:hypothetical protein [Actinomycetota bacterium]
MTESEPQIKVVLDYSASREEVDAVRATLAGERAEVEAQPPPTSGIGNGSSWMIWIYVSAPLNVFLSAFARRLAEKVADQVAEEGVGPALRAFFDKLWLARQDNPYPYGLARLVDTQEKAVVIYQMPDEAYDKLLETDWSAAAPGSYEWDPDAEDWVAYDQLIREGRHVMQRQLRPNESDCE